MMLIYPLYVVLLLAFTLLEWVLSPLLALCVKPDGNLPQLRRLSK